MSLQQRVLVLRPPRIAMSLVAAAAVVHLAFPWLILRPSWVGGLLLGAAGFSIMLRAWWLFRQAQTPICPTDVATSLLTHDVYRLSRNPMYLGIVMMMFAVALTFGTLPFLMAAATLFAILNFAFCPYEEGQMRAAFPAYRAYAARVRRWI